MREIDRYSRGERAADAAVHAIGVSAALVACALLAAAAPRPPGARLAVALYNLAGSGPRKALLHRLDHAVIFAMAAGAYPPVALLAMGGTWDAASTTDGSDDSGKVSDWLRVVSGSMARNSRHPCLQLRAPSPFRQTPCCPSSAGMAVVGLAGHAGVPNAVEDRGAEARGLAALLALC